MQKLVYTKERVVAVGWKGIGLLILAAGLWVQGRVALAGPAGGVADTLGGWTLEQCVRYALEHNLSLQQGALQAAGAELDLKSARLAMTPNLNASAGLAYNNGRAIDPFTNTFIDQTVESNQMGLNGSWLLYQGFQLRHQYLAAKLGQGASLKEQEALRNTIALTISNAYLQVLLAQELTRVAEEQKNTTQNQLDRIRILVSAGSLALENQFNLEAQLASEEVTLTNALNNSLNARIGLALLLQLPDPESFRVAIPDTLKLRGAMLRNQTVPENAQVLYQNAVGRQPQILGNDLRLQQSMANYKASLSLYYPRLSAFVNMSTLFASTSQRYTLLPDPGVPRPIGYLLDDPTKVVVQPVPQYRTELIPRGEQFRNNLGTGMGLSLSIPIWNNGQVRLAQERARNAVELAKVQSEQGRNQLYSDITRAVTDYKAAQARLQTNRINLNAQEANYQFAQKRFEEGLLTLADYLNAKNRLQIAESSWLQAYYEELFRLKVLDFYEGRLSWQNP